MSAVQHIAPFGSGRPRVVVLSLASDFGCQLQLTNLPRLLDALGTITLAYWQLVSSAPLPEKYDVAIIEGAVTTQDHIDLLQQVRATAHTVIALGSCAVTGGIPALATSGAVDDAAPDKERLAKHVQNSYGDPYTQLATQQLPPAAVSTVVSVDYSILGCPIDPEEFSAVFQCALLGIKERSRREPLCAYCKTAEIPCLYAAEQTATATPCLGLVTATGCGALCLTRGRPCTGCRGIAADANLPAARDFIKDSNFSCAEFDAALRIYNAAAAETENS
ncbi:MAG: NADH:ubiquinone oxidoreductase [Coriobacteriia bacterium]|nr:NADH:ubiquinone oxidoreductase [Coriobacteriia bacterium]